MCHQALEAEVQTLRDSKEEGTAALWQQLAEIEQALVGMAQVLHVPVHDVTSTRWAALLRRL